MPKTERYANNPTTTLNNGGSVNNSSDPVTFVVTSAALFPTDGNFRVKIDDEILLVTAVSGTSFTATRAQDGTSIATHTDASTVTGIITKGTLDKFSLDSNNYGVYASAPDIFRDGQRYKCTDFPFELISKSGSWSYWFKQWKLDLSSLSSFSSWVNQGSAAWNDFGPGKTLSLPPTAGGDSLRVRLATAPAGDFVFTTLMLPNFSFFNNLANFGIGLRNAGTGKLQTFTLILRSASQESTEIINWNSATSGSSNPIQKQGNWMFPIWLRLRRVTNDYFFEWSNDGYNWMLLYTTTTGGWTGTADGIFFYGNTVGNEPNQNELVHILHCTVV